MGVPRRRAVVGAVAMVLVALVAAPSTASQIPGGDAGPRSGAPATNVRELRGAPVSPAPVRLRQPDGSTFVAVPYGDSWTSGYETADGYTVVQDADGTWRYAAGREAGGALRAGATVTSSGAPTPPTRRHQRPSASAVGTAPLAPSPAPRNSGSQPTVVILVQFLDRPSVGSTQAD